MQHIGKGKGREREKKTPSGLIEGFSHLKQAMLIVHFGFFLNQNNNNPALASLMSFTLRLNQLERKLENRQAAIDRQTNAIARFRDDMQSKASKNYLERTADRLRSQITNVRELAEVQRAHAELYINRLYTVTNAFQVHSVFYKKVYILG